MSRRIQVARIWEGGVLFLRYPDSCKVKDCCIQSYLSQQISLICKHVVGNIKHLHLCYGAAALVWLGARRPTKRVRPNCLLRAIAFSFPNLGSMKPIQRGGFVAAWSLRPRRCHDKV